MRIGDDQRRVRTTRVDGCVYARDGTLVEAVRQGAGGYGLIHRFIQTELPRDLLPPQSLEYQIANLNQQVCDAFVLVNDGHFRANGFAGMY